MAHDRVDVAARPGVDVAVDDLAQALVAERAQRGLLALVGQPLARPSVRARCSALLTDGGGRLEHLGGLLRREAEHLAQDQHRALGRRQVLERRDEGELDALAPLVAGLGRRAAVLEAEPLVGIGLDPDRLDHRRAGAVVGVGGRAVVDRQHALRARRSIAFRQVLVAIRVEPRAQRAAALEARQPAPGPQQGVLQGVLGVVDRAEHAVAVGVELAAVGLDEAADRPPRRRRGPRRGAPLALRDAVRRWPSVLL